MAGSVNKVILVGNLGRDPEVRSMQDGRNMVNMSVATSETWRDRQSGERKERTEWHRVVIFNEKLAEVAQKFVRKGSKVYVEGQLSTRKWTDQSGQERYTTEVVIPRFGGALTMLDGRSGGGGGEGGVDRAGLADSKRADGDSARHLHDGEQRVEAVERLGLHGHAEHGQRRFRRRHAGQVRCAARAGDEDFEAASRRRRRILEHPVRRAVRGDDLGFVGHAERVELRSGVLHGLPVGLAAHDEADEGRR